MNFINLLWLLDLYKFQSFNIIYKNNIIYNIFNLNNKNLKVYNNKIVINFKIFIKNKFIFSLKFNNLYNLLKLNFIKLKLEGVGFTLHNLIDNIIELNIGYSHKLYVKLNLKFEISKNNTIIILNYYDIFILSTIGYKIKNLKVPNIYKVKGFKFI